jgi:hypothetical protein
VCCGRVVSPYVKVEVGSSEHFKTKTHENGDRAPHFEQAFLFNLTGVETDLHLKVYDSEVLTDTYIGRADLPLMQLLSSGGGEKAYDLYDPENFRKITGHIHIQLSFSGTGGPTNAAEQAPISGLFHFQHNSTGFLVHAVGDKLQLRAGGMNDLAHAFEFQGPYIRYVPNSQYLTGVSDGSLSLKAGISDDGKWRWTGIGLQQVSSNKLLHPTGDMLAANTVLRLSSGATAASGFSLVPCSGASSPATSSAPPATNPHAALPNIAGMAISQPAHASQYPNINASQPKPGGWSVPSQRHGRMGRG